MNLHGGTVHGDGFDFDRNQALFLKALEDLGERAVLTPPVHASINGVPISKFLWKPPPFAAVLRNVQKGIDDLKIVLSNITSLARKAVGYAFKLLLGDLHKWLFAQV